VRERTFRDMIGVSQGDGPDPMTLRDELASAQAGCPLCGDGERGATPGQRVHARSCVLRGPGWQRPDRQTSQP